MNPLDSQKKNWQTWSRSMCILFDIIHTRGYINGTIHMPDQKLYPNTNKTWHFNNTYIMMLITRNIAESKMIHTNDCDNVYDKWNNPKKGPPACKLSDIHGQSSDSPKHQSKGR